MVGTATEVKEMIQQEARVARLTACAALGTALLYLLSIPIGSFADAPSAGASGASVLHFIDTHRGGVLAASAMNGVAWCTLMPAAFAGMRELLSRRAGTAATVALICAAVESALIGLALVFALLCAYEAPGLAPGTARMLYDGFELASSASAWPTVPCALAFALAWRAHPGLSRAVGVLALLVAALHAIASVGFARSGALSPTGLPQAAPIAFALLMATIGVSLLRHPAIARAQTAVPIDQAKAVRA
jgi:hypothetical protein